MTVNRKIRVRVVGAGRIADLQVIGWREHPYGEVAVSLTVDPAVRARRGAEWGARPYDHLEDLLPSDLVLGAK